MNAGSAGDTNPPGMTQRRFRLAGLEAQVSADDEDVLADAARPWASYATSGDQPDIDVEIAFDAAFEGPAGDTPAFHVTADPLRFARFDCAGEVSVEAGRLRARFRGQPRPIVVEAALRIAFAVLLPHRGGLLLHASGLIAGPRGLLFLGPSGAGKSTVEKLARTGGGFRSLGDELTVARRVGESWQAFATPFAGENGPADQAQAPLGGVIFLEKADGHRVHALGGPAAFARLLRNVIAFPVDREAAARVLDVGADLLARVPAHVLEFARRTDVADVLGGL